MIGRLRSLLTFGSSLVLVAGIAIASISAINISTSNAALSAEQLLPALKEIQPDASALGFGVPIPKLGDFIGTLKIPRLNKTIPIYEGTEPAQLKKGAGHYQKSVPPGLNDNSVIAGHRDSVFTQFGSLKRGDELIIKTGYGKFIYRIDSFRIVKADDRTVIVPTPVATLTLSTCYPFHYVGSAPNRFIVSALLKS
jgi:sortase A